VKDSKRLLAVIDLETDPFQFGATLAPFACGIIIEGQGYFEFWGDECVSRAMSFLETVETPLMVYAHNGGKFDFYFFLEYLQNPLKIINGRVVKAKYGRHEFRDSYSIIPVALEQFDKLRIDYAKFTRELRDAHRSEILRYLRRDCDVLYELVHAFRERFGVKLTIAATAFSELEQFHPQLPLGPSHDSRFREFYYGGRVEYFIQGVLPGRWKVFDVNSMYPAVMRNADHPIGREYLMKFDCPLDADGWIKGYRGRMYFCEVEGTNHGALPVRTKAGLSFNEPGGVFTTTSHELTAAVQLGRFVVTRVRWAMLPMRTQRFTAYVDHWTREKLKAETAGDKVARYFAKTVMNSSYGKFGQNPEEYHDYWIEVYGVIPSKQAREVIDGADWTLHESHPKFRIWRKPASGNGAYKDVAIAASITSAARAVLMRALSAVKRPVYCDTDSVICEGPGSLELDPARLGAWKLEAKGTRVAIAGKKLYALFDGRECVKMASKGVHIEPAEIERVARGGEVVWQSDAPNFSLLHPPRYIKRRVRKDGHKFRGK
jgi:DNA polymerase elongation subunit (family B)